MTARQHNNTEVWRPQSRRAKREEKEQGQLECSLCWLWVAACAMSTNDFAAAVKRSIHFLFFILICKDKVAIFFFFFPSSFRVGVAISHRCSQ